MVGPKEVGTGGACIVRGDTGHCKQKLTISCVITLMLEDNGFFCVFLSMVYLLI